MTANKYTTIKIIKQLNHSVNASESTGISSQELNIEVQHF